MPGIGKACHERWQDPTVSSYRVCITNFRIVLGQLSGRFRLGGLTRQLGSLPSARHSSINVSVTSKSIPLHRHVTTNGLERSRHSAGDDADLFRRAVWPRVVESSHEIPAW